jgi:hypothetical protein
MADCRWRQAQLNGGALETAAAHDGEENPQVGKIDTVENRHELDSLQQ